MTRSAHAKEAARLATEAEAALWNQGSPSGRAEVLASLAVAHALLATIEVPE